MTTSDENRLEVYKMRLLTLMQNPCASQEDIKLYEDLINDIEAEMFFRQLMEATKIAEMKKLVTDCWVAVDEVCREYYVMKISNTWKWSSPFKIFWVVEYLNKKRCPYS